MLKIWEAAIGVLLGLAAGFCIGLWLAGLTVPLLRDTSMADDFAEPALVLSIVATLCFTLLYRIEQRRLRRING